MFRRTCVPSPARDVRRPLVRPDVGAAALRVVHDVLAAPGDDADVDRAAGGAGARHAVVAAVEVHAHLVGLGGEKATPEPGKGAPVREGDRDLHRVVGPARERHDLGLVRRVHVHLLRVVAIDAEEVVDEAGPARLERGQLVRPVDRVPRGRHLPQGVVDHVVGEPALQVLRHLLPGRRVEVAQQPAVDLEAVLQRPLELARVLRAELEQLRDRTAQAQAQHPVVVDEDHVRVLGQGLEELQSGDPHPPPLAAVVVVVVEPEVEGAGPEEGPAVDAVLGTGEPPLPQVGRGDDLRRAHEAGPPLRGRERVLVDRPELAGEGLAELPEGRVVGHDHEARVREVDARRLGERREDLAGGRVGVRALVLRDLRRVAVAPLLGQHALGVLAQGAEGVGLPVGALEREAEALGLADDPDRRQPAAGLLQVEDGHLDRRRPQVAVPLAEHELVEPAGLELGAGGHRARLLGTHAGDRDADQQQQSRHLSRTHPHASKEEPPSVGGASRARLSVSCHAAVWRRGPRIRMLLVRRPRLLTPRTQVT